jgi:hypothetical protein
LKGLIELKNIFNKRKKNQKREDQTEKNKTQKNWLKDEIERIFFNKSGKDKFRNLKKQGPKWKTKHMRKDWIEKNKNFYK